MSILDIIRGLKCDMCGRRKSDVAKRARLGGTFCNGCAKAYRQAGGTTNRNIHKRRT